MSIHKWKSFEVAQRKGAQAAKSFETWTYLTDLSKREMAEALIHLAALCHECGSYDEALEEDKAVDRVREEIGALRSNGMI